MNKRNLALILVVAGVIVYFYPQFSQLTNESSQITGAIFAVGGVILWYLPSKTSSKSKKK